MLSDLQDSQAALLPLSRQEFDANVKEELNSNRKRTYNAVSAEALAAMTDVVKEFSSGNRRNCKEIFRQHENNGVVFPFEWKSFRRQLRTEKGTTGEWKSWKIGSDGKLLCDDKEVLALEDYYPRMMNIVDEHFHGELIPRHLKSIQQLMGKNYYMSVSLLSVSNVFSKKVGLSHPNKSTVTQYQHAQPPPFSTVENHGNRWAMGPWYPPFHPAATNHVTYNVTNNITNNNHSGSGNVFTGATNMSDAKPGKENVMAEIKGDLETIKEGIRNLNREMREQTAYLRTMFPDRQY